MVFSSGLALLAIAAFVALVILITREGTDERARTMGYKLYSALFLILFSGLGLVAFISGFYTINYHQLRSCISVLMSLTIIYGLIYWIIIKRNY